MSVSVNPMIYLASPYSHEDAAIRQERYEQIKSITAQLIDRFEDRIVFFSPIVYGHTLAAACERTPKWGWESISREFLKRSELMIIVSLDGVEDSIGIINEITYCERHGIPYRRTVNGQLRSVLLALFSSGWAEPKDMKL